MHLFIVLAIIALAAVLLIGWIGRLQRKSRALEKHIDYSKMKEWKDDDW